MVTVLRLAARFLTAQCGRRVVMSWPTHGGGTAQASPVQSSLQAAGPCQLRPHMGRGQPSTGCPGTWLGEAQGPSWVEKGLFS